jgi:hypothetical protein
MGAPAVKRWTGSGTRAASMRPLRALGGRWRASRARFPDYHREWSTPPARARSLVFARKGAVPPRGIADRGEATAAKLVKRAEHVKDDARHTPAVEARLTTWREGQQALAAKLAQLGSFEMVRSHVVLVPARRSGECRLLGVVGARSAAPGS